MTWLRDGAKVSAAKMETKAEGDSHSLVIKNATIEDVGEYICQAENVTSKTELEVQSKEEKIEVENHIMQQMGIKGESIVFISEFYRVIIFSMSPIFTILQKSLFQRGGGQIVPTTLLWLQTLIWKFPRKIFIRKFLDVLGLA